MNPKDTESMDKYRSDIETIKSLLMKVEEKPIFESWIFFLGSFFSWTTTIIIYLAIKMSYISFSKGIIIMWLLLFTVGCSSECISRVRKTSSEAMPLFPRPIIKMYAGLVGASFGFAFITIMALLVEAYSLIPAIMLIAGAIFYLFYAQIAYVFLFAHSCVLLLLSMVLYFSGLTELTQLLLAGIVLSLSITVIGVHEWRNEKNTNAG